MNWKLSLCFSLFILTNCQKGNHINNLLNSKNKDDIILGTIKAGKSGDKKYVSYLLSNSVDWRKSTNFEFKGITVYQAKMNALQQIFKTNPPKEIDDVPDSLIIKFYEQLAKSSSFNISK